MEEEWGFFLIDARNAINEINRTVMLWVLRRAWTSGARFCFNCYQRLVHQGAIGKSVTITRGDLPSMICSGIGILPLIRRLKSESPLQNSNGLQPDILQTSLRLQQLGTKNGINLRDSSVCGAT